MPGISTAAINCSQSRKATRLLGWLVSYGLDKDGAAFEVRRGRTFISSSPLFQLNGNGNGPDNRCIALPEDGVSSLHVAFLGTAQNKIIMQDIFSDHGTYLTKSGKTDEQKVAGPVELGHGDWVRVGERIRFQVCLIDGRHE